MTRKHTSKRTISGIVGTALLAVGSTVLVAYSAALAWQFFLDVQMPKLTGFDVLELIGTDIPVIFVTAYDQHAMRAFEVHAVDYLLKPVGRERFEAALARAKKRSAEKKPMPVELAAAAARAPAIS